jgi:Flp pilus assembly protein TadD
MRSIALGLLILLAACSGGGVSTIGGGQPGLSVAQAALRGGAPLIALQVVGTLLAKNPGNDDALIIQGEALTQLGRLDEAAASFSTVLQHDPASVGAHIGLGRVRLASDPATAEVLFLEALQREPRNAVALNNLGIARDLQGHHGDAQTAYRQAMAANPSMTAARVNLALSLAMQGQPRDAVQLLRPLASDAGASRQVRHDLAAVLTMNGEKAEATAILSKDMSADEVRQAMEAYSSGRGLMSSGLPAAAPSGRETASRASPGESVQRASLSSDPARAAASLPVAAPPGSDAVASTSMPVTPASIGPAPVTPAAPAAAQESATSGAPLVQLAAAVSADAAQAEWQRLQQHMPDVMDGRQPIIAKVERNGQTFWRLRVGGFADAGQASAFCERLHAGGGACVVTR